jgi:hypothetical protein
MDQQSDRAVRDFVEHFERVFDGDWQFSKRNLTDRNYAGCYIDDDGTFLHPVGPGGDPENLHRWENRDALLAAYQKLKALQERP